MRINEYNKSNLNVVKSFKLKKELCPKVWDDYDMKEDIRQDLIKIAQDFYIATDLNVPVKDIILTGSLANYNWSLKYSDYDVHIVVNLADIDEDLTLVKKYVDLLKNHWNKEHDIKVSGFEVELYIQDHKEPHISSGMFSLLKNKWIEKPSKVEVDINDDLILDKAKSIMVQIDELSKEINEDEYEPFIAKLKKVWEKIRNMRKSGLEQEGGEYSTGNLAFKMLRRSGYIKKIITLMIKSYDKQFK